ncbi:MAG: transporter ATP-binding protein [Actinomycetota bacterium]|nr:transporter ATP-binding protein [Actinomycetota bacterium]
MNVPAIHVEDLTRTFGATTAVRDVDLTVAEGEIYGFLGRNGAGKTTLIRMLLGLIPPSRGRVELLGTTVRTAADRVTAGWRGRHPASLWSKVGYLVEGPGLYPQLTVADHLRMARGYRRLTAAAVDTVVERLDLGRYTQVRARALSLGNKQRLALALALVHRPPLVVLDEPVNGLDPAGVVEIRELLRELADDGVTVFMSTHLIGEVARLADRIGIIHDGRLLEQLDGERLGEAGAPRFEAAFRTPELAVRALDVLTAWGLTAGLGPDGTSITSESPKATDAPDDVATRLVEAGAPPTSLGVTHEDLEQLFLRLTEVTS